MLGLKVRITTPNVILMKTLHSPKLEKKKQGKLEKRKSKILESRDLGLNSALSKKLHLRLDSTFIALTPG
jgi:hypothetical protein